MICEKMSALSRHAATKVRQSAGDQINKFLRALENFDFVLRSYLQTK